MQVSHVLSENLGRASTYKPTRLPIFLNPVSAYNKSFSTYSTNRSPVSILHLKMNRSLRLGPWPGERWNTEGLVLEEWVTSALRRSSQTDRLHFMAALLTALRLNRNMEILLINFEQRDIRTLPFSITEDVNYENVPSHLAVMFLQLYVVL